VLVTADQNKKLMAAIVRFRLELMMMCNGILVAHGLAVLVSCCLVAYLYVCPLYIALVDRTPGLRT
jgi:hypothetical protein